MTAVTLLSDFGTSDGYVGEVKGVLATRSPRATVIDVAHDLPPGDVRGAAWILGRVWARFPKGTVHLVVVDPGVGGERLPVALRLAERWFVGPDNGLITLAGRSHAIDEARRIDPSIGEQPFSDTFHGRDLFAPAAAHLVEGRAASELGPGLRSADLVELAIPHPSRQGLELRGHVAHVDRFGNLITDLPVDWLPDEPIAEVAGTNVERLASSYDAVSAGTLLMSRGSGGTLEIAVRDGSARELLNVGRDDAVVVRPGG